MAIRQVGTESGHEEEFTDDKDQRDGADAEEVLDGGFMPDDHVAGDGIEQHLQALPGLCLASILMNSMPMTMSSARSRNDRISHIVAVNNKPGIHLMQV